MEVLLIDTRVIITRLHIFSEEVKKLKNNKSPFNKIKMTDLRMIVGVQFWLSFSIP